MKKVIALLAVALGASSLVAQDAKPFNVGVAAFLGTNDMKKITNSGTGYAVSFAYDTSFAGSDIPVRVGLALNQMPGKELPTGLKSSLRSGQVFGDLHIRMPLEGLHVVTGLSLNKYSLSNSGTEIAGTTSFVIKETKGLKFGARAGFDYQISPSCSVECLLQITELGRSPMALGNSPSTYKLSRGPLNPSWVQVGARYHF